MHQGVGMPTWLTQTTATEKASLMACSLAPKDRKSCARWEACEAKNSTLKRAAIESTTTSLTGCWLSSDGNLYCS